MTRRLSLIRDLCDAPEVQGLPRGVALREIEEIASGEAGRILPTDLQTHVSRDGLSPPQEGTR